MYETLKNIINSPDFTEKEKDSAKKWIVELEEHVCDNIDFATHDDTLPFLSVEDFNELLLSCTDCVNA